MPHRKWTLARLVLLLAATVVWWTGVSVPGECSPWVKSEDGRVAVGGPFTVGSGDRSEDLDALVAAPTFVEITEPGGHERVLVRASHGGIRGEAAWVARGGVVRLPVPPGAYEIQATVKAEDGSWPAVAGASGSVSAGDLVGVDL